MYVVRCTWYVRIWFLCPRVLEAGCELLTEWSGRRHTGTQPRSDEPVVVVDQSGQHQAPSERAGSSVGTLRWSLLPRGRRDATTGCHRWWPPIDARPDNGGRIQSLPSITSAVFYHQLQSSAHLLNGQRAVEILDQGTNPWG